MTTREKPQNHPQAFPYWSVEMLWETGPQGLAPTHQGHGSLGVGGYMHKSPLPPKKTPQIVP